MAGWLNWLLRQFVPAGTPADVALREWFRESGYWYITSAVAHAILFVLLAIVMTMLPGMNPFKAWGDSETITLDATNVQEAPDGGLVHVNVGEASLEPTPFKPEDLVAPPAAQSGFYVDESEKVVEPGGGRHSDKTNDLFGGLGGLSLPNLPGPAGGGGLGNSRGESNKPGVGEGIGGGFGGRGSGNRKQISGPTGGTPAADQAVKGGLNWLARHQAPAGNWSLQHSKYCKHGGSCSGEGSIQHDAGATALALLAFQAAGQTHKLASGPYHRQCQKAISWLMKHQNPRTGDLSAGDPQPMYSHGLATIALCEAYAMTRDAAVGAAATKAVRLIEQGQNEVLGGWRYHPGSHDADTSVTGWQVMALKSAQMAGIGVNSQCFEGVRKWLASVAQ